MYLCLSQERIIQFQVLLVTLAPAYVITLFVNSFDSIPGGGGVFHTIRPLARR